MFYFVSEVQMENGVKFTAGSKARDDVENILSTIYYNKIPVFMNNLYRKKQNVFAKAISHYAIKKEWENHFSVLKSGDVLLIQFPIINHTFFFGDVINKLKTKGVKIVLLIHDLELFRTALRDDKDLRAKIRINFEEKSVLSKADYIIAHNNNMIRELKSLGIKSDYINLQIFDYLIPGFSTNNKDYRKFNTVIIAGALKRHKAGYVYELPNKPFFNLYGIGYEDNNQSNIIYKGVFSPDELPFLLEGDFGLVWDGNSSKSCEGVYGKYLMINNPHKTSLYLATGIPVIIWKKAALSDFILENKCGLAIDSLSDIDPLLKNLKNEEYKILKENAIEIGEKLRSGFFLKECIKKIK